MHVVVWRFLSFQLTFSLSRPNDNFEIVPGLSHNTAIVRTKATFDRETQSYYDLTVIAKDGAPSDRPGHLPHGTPNSGIFCQMLIYLSNASYIAISILRVIV